MRIHDVRPAPGSHARKTRRGRGLGSGLGKTAGRGQKGQKSRSGAKIRPGFEGGQMPLVRRLAKRGFVNPFRVEYEVVNVGSLNVFDPGTEVTPELLRQKRLVRRPLPIKILGEGELDRPLVVRAQAFSASARAKIEEAAGKAEVI